MKEKISRGATFQGTVSAFGLVLLLAGIILLFITEYNILSGLIILTGIAPFLSIRGVMIDYTTRKIKPYLDLFILKIGKWYDIDDYERISIRLFTESQTMNMVSISNTFKTRTFDVKLESDNSKNILIRDFTDYAEAKSFAERFSSKLNKPVTDYHALMMENRDKGQ